MCAKKKTIIINTAAYILFVLGVSVIISVFIIMLANDIFALTKEDDSIEIEIKNNARRQEIAKTLKDNGIIEYSSAFSAFMSIMNVKDGDIKGGSYYVNPGLDYRAIINSLKSSANKRETVRITIPEGYTTEQIIDSLAEHKVCSADELWDAVINYDFKNKIVSGLEKNKHRLEGYLYPDTYDFYIGDTAPNAIARFLDNFDNKFTDDMKKRAEDLGYSVHEILTVASLVEREAKLASEQAVIAGVIYNRLNNSGFKHLEIDASIQYILGHKEKLTYDDLQTDSPYNTYKNSGLPPTPIANPGYGAINASLYPDKNSFYYYVAKSDGSHIFSKTLAEHNKAKASVN